MRNQKLLSVVAAVGLGGTLAACGSAQATGTTSDVVKIGMVVPLTGPFAPLGQGDKAAALQEVATLNKAGGIDGKKVELVIKDDKSDVTQSVTEFNQLAVDKSYTAILSSSNVSASTAVGPSAKSNKIPIIALSPVSAFADGSNPWAFTGVATPEVYGQAIVDYLKATGIETLAVGYNGKDVYGPGGNEATKAAAAKAGIDIVLDEPFDPGATDFSALIKKVEDAKPEGFLVWGAGPAPVIMTKQFAGSGIPLFMTGAQASNLYIQPSGAAAEGVTMTSSIAVPGRQLPAGPLKDLVDAFANPWLQANDNTYPPQFAFDGVTAVQLLRAAIEKAGSTDRQKVRDALESLDVLTPTGRFTFSKTDHAGLDTNATAVVTVKDGDLVATDYSLERFKTDLPK
jgi:branched-chain amino acid transport system substrate-binding protein